MSSTPSLPLPRVNIPSTLVIGGGASRQAGQEAARLRITHALVVTDAFINQAGLAGQVINDLSKAGIKGTLFADVTPDPTVANVQAGLALFQRAGCDGVVAIGGGSSLDAAKAIAVLSTNGGQVADYMGYHKIPLPGAPLIAIPTTAGTGSEVTKVIVITEPERNVKMMILDAHLLPTAALVDYELTLTMPPILTASVGLDSLTHAIESYVSKKANPFTDLIALEAARLIAAHIRVAYAEPENRVAREAMMYAATLGGIAFSNASVALVHGMSRPLGACFHVPHGLSNAMLLPAITEFSLPGAPERYASIARHTGFSESRDDAQAGRDLVAGLRQLNEDLRVPTLQGYGIPSDAFEPILEQMARDALASGSPANNPRLPAIEEMVALYRTCYQ